MTETANAEKVESTGEPIEGSPSFDEFDILGPTASPLRLSTGDVLTFTPMKVKEIRQFMPHAKKFMQPLAKGLKQDGTMDVKAVSDIDPDGFIKALCVAARMTEEQIDDLLPNDFALVVSKVLVVNMDFFVQHLPDTLSKAGKAVARSYENAKKKLQQSSLPNQFKS